jgi:hypothetical protein
VFVPSPENAATLEWQIPMTRFRVAFVACNVLCATAFPASAHHGQDFLLIESPQVPHPGDAYLLANSAFALDDAEERAGFEPALLVGVTPRIAFELHAHAERLAGESWRYEATAPAIHVLLSDPARHDGLKVGLSAEYEIARAADEADNLQFRLGIERARGAMKWAGNLVYDREQGGDRTVGAALGWRRQLDERFALGVEAQGAFDHGEGRELLGGLYWEHEQRWTLKFGLGVVQDDSGGYDPLARLGLVLRLRD